MAGGLAPSLSLAVDRYAGHEETVMYHGTDSHAAQLIVRSQRFYPSGTGLLGPGVYVTLNQQKAEGYRTHHPFAPAGARNAPLASGEPDPGCILRFRVRLGACKLMTRDMPRAALKTWHDEEVPDPTPGMRAAGAPARASAMPQNP